MDRSPTLRVLILGHSFVRRLEEYTRINYYSNLNVASPRLQVHFSGIGGLRATDLMSHFSEVEYFRPNVVIVDAGSNDLANGILPATVDDHIQMFFDACLSFQVEYCMSLQQLYRFSSHKYTVPDNFNNCIVQLNNLLGKSGAQHSSLWKHRCGLWVNWQSYLLPDGTHLNDKGMVKYFKSVRQGVKYALSRLQVIK